MRLFYRSDDAVMAVSVKTDPTFKRRHTQDAFSRNLCSVALHRSDGTPWDISPDGKRFLMMKEAASPVQPAAGGPRKINIVLNWFEELKQRVPVP